LSLSDCWKWSKVVGLGYLFHFASIIWRKP